MRATPGTQSNMPQARTRSGACVALALLLAVANAAPCTWRIADARTFTHASLQRLCHLLNCSAAACPRACVLVHPPDAVTLPPRLDANTSARLVRDVWPSARLECDTHKRLVSAAGDTAAARSPTPAVVEYDVVLAPWDPEPPPRVSGCEPFALVSAALARVRCASDAATLAALRAVVASARPRVRPRPLNEWVSQWIEHGAAPAPGVVWGATGLVRWDAALDGRGETIGTVDTGVDTNSAYLRDPSVSLPPYAYCGANGAPDARPAWFDRRKVVQYVTDGDATGACGDATDTDGHGTHTAGTAAGAADCAPGVCASDVARFDGVAPGARLAVFDAGPDPEGYLIIPPSLAAGVFPWAYDRASARVHSNSWGAWDAGVYGTIDYQVDAYIEEHPDFVVVIAAGNTGADSGSGARVGSPGLAKNAITVGASGSPAESADAAWCGGDSYAPDSARCTRLTDEAAAGPNNVAYFSSYGTTSGARRVKPDLVAPGYGVFSALNEQPAGGASGAADAADGRSAWRAGTVALMAGTSMATPQIAGAAALVRQYFAHGYWPCGAPDSGVRWTRVPAALVKAVLVALAVDLTGRQANAAGTTVRSIARATQGYPNPWQGYGTPRLGALLRTDPGHTDVAPLTLPALDVGALPDGVDAEHAFTTTGQSVSYTVCIWAPYGGAGAWPLPPRVALVWTDPALAPLGGSGSDLVNDLDLSVIDVASGDVLAIGNHEMIAAVAGDAARVSPATQPDTTSNVEVATLRTPPAVNRTLVVQVVAARILLGPQRFSLVLAGGWGACGAGAAERCELPRAPTPTPTAPPSAPPFERFFVPRGAPVALLFAGTARACDAASCATGWDTVAPLVEAVVALRSSATSAAVSAAVTVRVRAIHDPAAFFAPLAVDDTTVVADDARGTPLPVAAPSPAAWWPGGDASARIAWATRITLIGPDAPAGGADVYVSLSAQADAGSAAVRTNQRLVIRHLDGGASDDDADVPERTWRLARDAALSQTDITALATGAVRVSGVVRLVDAVVALQILAADADSAFLCANGARGCECDRSTAHGYELPAWRPVLVTFAACAAAAAVLAWVYASAPPANAYARLPKAAGMATTTWDTDDDAAHDVWPTPRESYADTRDAAAHVAALLAQLSFALAASVRARTLGARVAAWCAVCVAAAAGALAYLCASSMRASTVRLLPAAAAAAGTIAALAADAASGGVYADLQTLTALAGGACVALVATDAPVARALAAYVVGVTYTAQSAALRLDRDTQAAVGASGAAVVLLVLALSRNAPLAAHVGLCAALWCPLVFLFVLVRTECETLE